MSTIKSIDTRKLVMLALLTAIVVVLQVLASVIPIYPFRLNLVLIPIVIGAAMIGPLAGCWLGLVFGAVVLINSPDVIPFMTFNPLATIGLVLLRGAIAGLAAGLIYSALAKKSKTIAVLVAAAISAIANTGIFIVGIYLFFLPVLADWGVSGAADIAYFVFIGMVGFNFLFEMAINLVFSPTIVRLLQYAKEHED
jgi:uncharacterized membrane protein